MKAILQEPLALAILQELEDFRNRLNTGATRPGEPDWVVRMCEAIIAEFASFPSRNTWTSKLERRYP
jgi:hypothetical protein